MCIKSILIFFIACFIINIKQRKSKDNDSKFNKITYVSW